MKICGKWTKCKKIPHECRITINFCENINEFGIIAQLTHSSMTQKFNFSPKTYKLSLRWIGDHLILSFSSMAWLKPVFRAIVYLHDIWPMEMLRVNVEFSFSSHATTDSHCINKHLFIYDPVSIFSSDVFKSNVLWWASLEMDNGIVSVGEMRKMVIHLLLHLFLGKNNRYNEISCYSRKNNIIFSKRRKICPVILTLT